MKLGLNLGLTELRGATGGGADGSIADILSSAVCDFDVNVAASNDGTDTDWKNLVTSPADGASQTDYDLTNGLAGANKWVSTGTIGTNAVWLNSGNDLFTQSTGIASTPTWAKMHRTDQTNGFGFYYAFELSTPAGADNWFGTADVIGEVGWRTRINSSERMDLLQNDGSSNNIIANLTSILASNTKYFFVLTWDGSLTTNNVVGYLNGVKVVVSDTFNAVTTDAITDFVLGFSMDNNHKAHGFGTFKEFINDTQAADLKTFVEARSPFTYP